MKITHIKKIALVLGCITLLSNATPLFAQIVELHVLGGGYKIYGPSQINFAEASTSAFPSTQQADMRDILLEHQGDGTDSYGMRVIDENGGNPFDVTVTVSEMKRSEALETTTLTGSNNTTLKVVSSIGFQAGDTIIIDGLFESSFTIDSIVDTTTIELTSPFGLTLDPGVTVSRIVDCELTPRKCLSLSGLFIRNFDDNGNPIDVINGSGADLSLNAQTNLYTAFMGETTTIDGSSGSTLMVNDSSSFFLNERITFPSISGVWPQINTIVSIDNANQITLQTPFTTAPGSDINVKSAAPRTLTLVNGTGAEPGQFIIYPSLQEILPAGQMSGLYQSTLSFTIV